MNTESTQAPESLGSPLCSPPAGWRESCDGKGCICAAHDQCECACDADWTPREVYELTEALISAQEEIASLKRDAAKQSEIKRLRKAIETAVKEFESINWGWDGDCGSGEIISILEDAILRRTPKLTNDHRTNDSQFTRKLRRGGH